MQHFLQKIKKNFRERAEPLPRPCTPPTLPPPPIPSYGSTTALIPHVVAPMLSRVM